MKYKLVAIDMDGTLLNREKMITPAVEKAVRRSADAGAIICLSSGRPYCGLKKYISQLSLHSPVIACNGAVIAESDGHILFNRRLSNSAARTVLAYAERFDATVCAWSGSRLLVNKINDRVTHYQSMDGSVAELMSAEEMITCGLDKILWHDEADRVEYFQQILPQELCSDNGSTSTPPDFSFFTSNPRFLEFVDSSVSKANALDQVSKSLGIAREEVIAIGDAFNDLDMLRWAGLSIAMGNAHDELKQLCGWVAPTNNEDGVAAALEKFILCEE